MCRAYIYSTIRSIFRWFSFLLLGSLLLASILLFLGIGKIQLLDGFDSGIGPTLLKKETFTILVHGKNSSDGALWNFLQAQRSNQSGAGVAEEGILQVLLGLEGGVGLGRIGGQAIHGETVRGQLIVIVAEEAGLLCT